jgi:hypothetical protein
LRELQDWISNKLTWAVPSYFATTVYVDHRSSVGWSLRVLGSFSGRENALMFEQDYGLRAVAVYDLTVDRSLQLPCFVVFNEVGV